MVASSPGLPSKPAEEGGWEGALLPFQGEGVRKLKTLSSFMSPTCHMLGHMDRQEDLLSEWEKQLSCIQLSSKI